MPTVLCAALNAAGAPHVGILEQAGFEVRDIPSGMGHFDEDTLLGHLEGCVAVMAGSEPYSRRIIESCPQLRVIARSGVGYDAVDLAACNEASIVVTTTPGVNHHSVAEHTFALLLGVARGFPDLDRQVREDRWKRVRFPRVMGATLGIVGLGSIGRAVATRAVGLGMKVIATEPYPDKAFVEKWGIELLKFPDLLKRSDFVSLHLPMSADNRQLMNADTFGMMKVGSVFINTARGQLVDEAALAEALRSGHLRGAGLDVFDVEPLPMDSPLLEFPNILFAPHTAGLDEPSWYDTFTMVAETIVELRDGDWPTERIRNLDGVTNWKWDRG